MDVNIMTVYVIIIFKTRNVINNNNNNNIHLYNYDNYYMLWCIKEVLTWRC